MDESLVEDCISILNATSPVGAVDFESLKEGLL